jgi:hypothetical protein
VDWVPSERARLLAWLCDAPDQVIFPRQLKSDPPAFAPGVTAQHRFDAHVVLDALSTALLYGGDPALVAELHKFREAVEGPVLANYAQAVERLVDEAQDRAAEIARLERAHLDPSQAIEARERHYRLIPPYLWQFDPNFAELPVGYFPDLLGHLSRKGGATKWGPSRIAAMLALKVGAFGRPATLTPKAIATLQATLEKATKRERKRQQK